MYNSNKCSEIRANARCFEEALPSGKRKQLGQYFTGVPLGKLLVYLALTSDMRAVLDPMAGHGDLLDVTAEAAHERGISIEHIDGIEIDGETAQVCHQRLSYAGVHHSIICDSAFISGVIGKLPQQSYDLVVTNPPYVRYQGRNVNGTQNDVVRSGLEQIIGQHHSGIERVVWSALAKGYSGLADLSVPSWLLAGLMVKPGGRLALVAPATWRSRNYGDVIRYLLMRCFQLEYIVEDKQPGWFPDAMIRTNLIIARRLSSQDLAQPLEKRDKWVSAKWITIAPEAANATSLVGAAFTSDTPEAEFADWLCGDPVKSRHGIQVREFPLNEEWYSLKVKAFRRSWCRALEGSEGNRPLFSDGRSSSSVNIPQAVRDIMCDGIQLSSLSTLEDSGISVGQGLRTGCNRFFYVDVCGPDTGSIVRVKASSSYQGREFLVPVGVLRPVLRKQVEIPLIESGKVPNGRILDLRQWVLPEDADSVTSAEQTYRQCGEIPPQIMPDDLADYVRYAAEKPLDDAEESKCATSLSAVCTNVRIHRSGCVSPRFWYMLPDYKPRHMPAVFVARVIHETPRVECNLQEPILVDANFSTIWASNNRWSRFALKALLNSAWCQILMEVFGTPLGGGALKLEATHLRQLVIPILSKAMRCKLDEAGRILTCDTDSVLARIDDIVFGAVLGKTTPSLKRNLARSITERTQYMRRMRRGVVE